MSISSSGTRRSRKIADKAAQWVITVAGVAVIASMIAMVALMLREAAPLFAPASQKETATAALPPGIGADDVAALGVDVDFRGRHRAAGLILRDGRAGFMMFAEGGESRFDAVRLAGAPETGGIRFVERHGDNLYSVLWENGTAALYAMRVEADSPNGAAASFDKRYAIETGSAGKSALRVFLRGDETAYQAVVLYDDGTVTETRLAPKRGLRAAPAAPSERTSQMRTGVTVRASAMSGGGVLYLGTDSGELVTVDFSAAKEVKTDVTPAFRDRRPVSSLAFLSGDYAVAAGDGMGGTSVWFPRREGGEFRLRRSVGWRDGGDAVIALSPSGRNRGFFTLDTQGRIRWLYSTNGRELLDMPAAPSPAVALAVNVRADALATLHSDGSLRLHELDQGYPEGGWRGFFSKLLYEGHEAASFMWQSSGSDANEPKLSLVPLIWGSVKAAAYALIFAAPLALAAAMHLSQFASPEWRARLKPAVEMLAAVPSVVVGFIAALWLAPLMERHLGFLAGSGTYDQRNSLVIAVAMGFAVIPTIFSLAEDAISAVPPSLSAASLALGASKWQTVWRVVLPTASPGIFTAVMLGLGRAVGETMIVLMAAGNTPIISLSPFSGMRTLSANIAVEMPEAPVGETLYRTLFLCAFLLFALTLVINTAAEAIRHRLRNRYGRV